ncbi:hypothetical protein FACS1894111_06610 [Clostridia bacterium]|nr:hypothetical protein FACS1894111_06610 [Clostridia bacterium]
MNIGVVSKDRMEEFAGCLTPDLVDFAKTSDSVLIAAGEEDHTAGLLLVSYEDPDIRIVSLQVADGYDFHEVGLKLIYALTADLTQMAADVICDFTSEKLGEFFEEADFEITKSDVAAFSITLKELSKNKFLNQPLNKNVIPFRNVPPKAMERYVKHYMVATGMMMPPFALSLADYDDSHALSIGGEVYGSAVFGDFELLWLHCEKEHTAYLPALLSAVYQTARTHIDPEVQINFTAINQASHALAERIAADSKISPVYQASIPFRKLAISAMALKYADELIENTQMPDWLV